MHESIAKYLANEMSEEEKLTFESQLVEDIDLQEELYFQLNLIAETPFTSSFDSEKAYAKVSSQINSAKIVKMPSRKNRFWLRVAATLLIVLTAGYFISDSIPSIKSPQQTVYTASNDVNTFKLEDGTLVRLNANSSLVVSKNFGKDKREVQLVGAANFDVTSNPDVPFIITANKGEVEVLGTSFEVEAYPDQQIELSVAEGKVKFASTTTDKEDLFIAGEKGVLSADGQELTKLELKNSNYSAWWTKRLVFENAPLSEVISDLEKAYRVQIDYNQEIGSCEYSAILENYTVAEAMEALQLTFQNIQSVEIKDSNIKLEGTACNH